MFNRLSHLNFISSWTRKLFSKIFLFKSRLRGYKGFVFSILPRMNRLLDISSWTRVFWGCWLRDKSFNRAAKELFFFWNFLGYKSWKSFTCLIVTRTWGNVRIFVTGWDFIKNWLSLGYFSLLLGSSCYWSRMSKSCYLFWLPDRSTSRNSGCKHRTLLIFVNWLVFFNWVTSRPKSSLTWFLWRFRFRCCCLPPYNSFWLTLQSCILIMARTNSIIFDSCIDFLRISLLYQFAIRLFITINVVMRWNWRRIKIFLPNNLLFSHWSNFLLLFPFCLHFVTSWSDSIACVSNLRVCKSLDSWLEHACIFWRLLNWRMSWTKSCLAIVYI